MLCTEFIFFAKCDEPVDGWRADDCYEKLAIAAAAQRPPGPETTCAPGSPGRLALPPPARAHARSSEQSGTDALGVPDPARSKLEETLKWGPVETHVQKRCPHPPSRRNAAVPRPFLGRFCRMAEMKRLAKGLHMIAASNTAELGELIDDGTINSDSVSPCLKYRPPPSTMALITSLRQAFLSPTAMAVMTGDFMTLKQALDSGAISPSESSASTGPNSLCPPPPLLIR